MGFLKPASILASRSRATDLDARHASSAEARDWLSLVDRGQLPDALDTIDHALRIALDDPALLAARAEVLRTWGRDHEASTTVARAAGGAALPALDRLRGWSALRLGRADDAIAYYQRALDGGDDSVVLAKALAAASVAGARFDDAASLYRELRARAPDDASLLLDAGVGELRAKRHGAAVEQFERLVSVLPDDAAAYEHLGVALSAMDRTNEAVAALERSVALAATSPADSAAFGNLGVSYAELGRWADASRVLVDGLRRTPDLTGHLQLGVALLALGRFTNGWRQYEHRWLTEPLLSQRARFGVPAWTGQPLEGRTVLVRSEQGLGDVFQFVRFLPRLKALGARVLFQPLKGMDLIARRFPGVDEMVAEGERLPPFDYVVNLMSLPLAFGTTVDTIPCDIPYLAPAPAYADRWRPRFASRPRPVVGLVWAGRPVHRTDRHRSLTLRQLAPLLEVADVRFVSLQKGPAAVQAEAVPDSVDWLGVGAELDDLDDATAVLAELDLLVCVDTGLAHLAAAMGKPVWVMLPEPADYRWMVGREDTPWYPTMRLFRQAVPRDWGPVVERVATELARWRESWRAPGASEARVGVRADPGRHPPPRREDEPPLSGLAAVAETRAGLMRIVPDDTPIGQSLAYAGEWLVDTLEVALSAVRPGMTLVEAGADVGAHTVPLARALGYDGTLLAYEDRPMQRRLLADNLALHGLPHATAMTRTLGAPDAGGFTAQRETIDDLRLSQLDGLKLGPGVDAAGVLAGATGTVWRCRPWILAEGAAPQRLTDALREFGYRWWTADVPLFRVRNFNRREPDVFAGATMPVVFAAPEEGNVSAMPDGWREAS